VALPITSLTAAALALLLAFLAILTIRIRVRHGISFGDGDNPALRSASRAHGNLAEYAPIGLIVIGLLEVAAVNRTALAIGAASFVLGRLLHTIGLFGPPGPPPAPARAIGIVLTLLTLIALAGWLLVVAVDLLGG
jgi:uncharacterized protein